MQAIIYRPMDTVRASSKKFRKYGQRAKMWIHLLIVSLLVEWLQLRSDGFGISFSMTIIVVTRYDI
jgi:hypothetical protein